MAHIKRSRELIFLFILCFVMGALVGHYATMMDHPDSETECIRKNMGIVTSSKNGHVDLVELYRAVCDQCSYLEELKQKDGK